MNVCAKKALFIQILIYNVYHSVYDILYDDLHDHNLLFITRKNYTLYKACRADKSSALTLGCFAVRRLFIISLITKGKKKSYHPKIVCRNLINLLCFSELLKKSSDISNLGTFERYFIISYVVKMSS